MDSRATPEQLTDQKRARHMLDLVLGQMEPDLRTVFILYEFEEVNLHEIAGVLGIPRHGRVASATSPDRIPGPGGCTKPTPPVPTVQQNPGHRLCGHGSDGVDGRGRGKVGNSSTKPGYTYHNATVGLITMMTMSGNFYPM